MRKLWHVTNAIVPAPKVNVLTTFHGAVSDCKRQKFLMTKAPKIGAYF